MRKESFQGILLGIVIMCAVFAFITIAWAAFSSNLVINGTATVSAQKWKVEFTDTKDTALVSEGVSATIPAALTPTLVGSATAPASNGFAITSTLVAGNASSGSATQKELGTLAQSGDKIIYHWYIQNFGTFQADFSVTGILASGSFTTGGGNITLTCKKAGDVTESTLCNNNLVAKLYIADYSSSYSATDSSTYGTLINSSYNGSIAAETATTDDTDVKIVTLVVEFNETTLGTSVISNDALTLSMSDVTLTATQHTTAGS